ncbi:MAG: amidohydrolase family protein [Anaerolineales bacterium]|nr:amidohydrolase family protein [Anaerolineales bacterium]
MRRAATQDPARFARWFTESADPQIHTAHVPNLLVYRTALRWLAEWLSCAPTVEAILAARAVIPEDEYARALLRDANIAVLLCDYGYGGNEALDHAGMSGILSIPIYRILRLERVAEELLLVHDTFAEFVDAYDQVLADARRQGVVAFKSIIAYRTGLAIDSPNPTAAEAGFGIVRATVRETGRIRLANKYLCDFIVHRGLAVQLQALPFQFHTGFGDADADLRTANPSPAQFRTLSCGAAGSAACGWPYYRETAHLAAIYANVWLDLSLAIPFATVGIPTMIRDVLGMAPFSKVMFATDAFTMPEIYWVAAKWGRWGVQRVLEELIDDGLIGEDEAIQVARSVFHESATRLYGV